VRWTDGDSPGVGVKEPERAGERGAMGAGARRMYRWAVEDAPMRAPDGQGVGGNAAGNAAQISQSWGADWSNSYSGSVSGAARSKAGV